MKIHNIRLGFATNSSSTHSFIFLEGAVDEWPYEINDFGWSFFTAASKEAKLNYLAATCFQNMSYVSSGDVAQQITEMLLGVKVPIDKGYSDWDIDHQSLITLPRSWFGITPDEQFLEHLKRFFIETEDLVILGGNDNDEEGHYLAREGGGFVLPVPIESSREDWVCRWDPEYLYWTFFSRGNGTKMRMSFDNLRKEGSRESRYERSWTSSLIQKAFAPELVDLKITEVCNNDSPCKKYCYQNSCSEGKHCDLQTLGKVAEIFAEMKVFEVALGGGDPMEHPHFLEVLGLFRKYGVVPSFSTRKTEWLREKQIRERIFEAIGAVGFSVSTVKEVRSLGNLLKKVFEQNIPRNKIKLHYVMGSTSLWEFSKIISFLSNRKTFLSTEMLLLLAFKEKGRGYGFPRYPYYQCIQILLDQKIYRINADTAFLQEFREEIREKCPDLFLEFQEGKFSCYVDPIKGIIAPSSFGGEEESFLPEDGVDRFKEIFAQF